MKKTLSILAMTLAAFACNNNAKTTAAAPEYVVRKISTSCMCQVWLKTAAPVGELHLGPFKTKAEATKAMCADIDPTMSDKSKCWETNPADACKK